MPRCPNGTRKNRKTGANPWGSKGAEPLCIDKQDIVTQPRCMNGERRNRKTRICENKIEKKKPNLKTIKRLSKRKISKIINYEKERKGELLNDDVEISKLNALRFPLNAYFKGIKTIDDAVKISIRGRGHPVNPVSAANRSAAAIKYSENKDKVEYNMANPNASAKVASAKIAEIKKIESPIQLSEPMPIELSESPIQLSEPMPMSSSSNKLMSSANSWPMSKSFKGYIIKKPVSPKKSSAKSSAKSSHMSSSKSSAKSSPMSSAKSSVKSSPMSSAKSSPMSSPMSSDMRSNELKGYRRKNVEINNDDDVYGEYQPEHF